MNSIKEVKSQLVNLFKNLKKVKIINKNKLHCFFYNKPKDCVFEIIIDVDKFLNNFIKSFEEQKGEKKYNEFLKDKKSKRMEVAYKYGDDRKIFLLNFKGLLKK